jgi:hypothetical protein
LRTRSLYLNGQGKVKGQMGTGKIFFHESFHTTIDSEFCVWIVEIVGFRKLNPTYHA